jgi:negative modulator of initiation of replication
MDQEQYEELRSQLNALETGLREVRKALELHAPERAVPVAEAPVAKPSADDLSFSGSELSAFLESDDFEVLSEAVDRFLGILGFLHHFHGEGFAKVSEIRGRKRVYFSRSAQEIEMSGRATTPRQIPGSDWFVVTNNSTSNKAALLVQVCQALGQSAADSIAASRAIDPDAGISLDHSQSSNLTTVSDSNGIQI